MYMSISNSDLIVVNFLSSDFSTEKVTVIFRAFEKYRDFIWTWFSKVVSFADKIYKENMFQ